MVPVVVKIKQIILEGTFSSRTALELLLLRNDLGKLFTHCCCVQIVYFGTSHRVVML